MKTETSAVMQKTIDMFALLTGKTFTAVEVRHLDHLHRMVREAENVAVATEALRTGSTAPVLESILAKDPISPLLQREWEQSLRRNKSTTIAEAARQAIQTGHSAILVDPEAVPAVKLLEDICLAEPAPEAAEEFPTVLRTSDKAWRRGYFFKIMVTFRDNARYHDAFTVHYVERPTQAEFDEHFALFLAGECYVYIMQGDGKFRSWGITHEFTKHIDANGKVVNEKPVETFDADDSWPDGKSWRIKFHDARIAKTNYLYFAGRPSGFMLNKYHSAKGFAVAEQRPS